MSHQFIRKSQLLCAVLRLPVCFWINHFRFVKRDVLAAKNGGFSDHGENEAKLKSRTEKLGQGQQEGHEKHYELLLQIMIFINYLYMGGKRHRLLSFVTRFERSSLYVSAHG